MTKLSILHHTVIIEWTSQNAVTFKIPAHKIYVCFPQRGCTNLLKGDTRASRANMTEQNYQRIFCSNMMKANQDIIKDGLTEQSVDIFIENSE